MPKLNDRPIDIDDIRAAGEAIETLVELRGYLPPSGDLMVLAGRLRDDVRELLGMPWLGRLPRAVDCGPLGELDDERYSLLDLGWVSWSTAIRSTWTIRSCPLACASCGRSRIPRRSGGLRPPKPRSPQGRPRNRPACDGWRRRFRGRAGIFAANNACHRLEGQGTLPGVLCRVTEGALKTRALVKYPSGLELTLVAEQQPVLDEWLVSRRRQCAAAGLMTPTATPARTRRAWRKD